MAERECDILRVVQLVNNNQCSVRTMALEYGGKRSRLTVLSLSKRFKGLISGCGHTVGGGGMVGCNNACACAVHSKLIHVVSMARCSS